MYYLTTPEEIRTILAELAEFNILWLDTEVANYDTKYPRLSLIQVSTYCQDLTGARTCIFDVLDRPHIVDNFINLIMINPQIEKVFHNAQYDLRFLGGDRAKNVTCTLDMARSIPYHILPVSSHSLKYLTHHLTEFRDINKEEQGGDWGQRPLTESQLKYAALDTVYLAQVHLKLLELLQESQSQVETENILDLEQRYREIEKQWKLLDSEMKDLKERIKKTMSSQQIKETSLFKLSSVERKTIKVNFIDLAELCLQEKLSLDLPITLTKETQKNLGRWLNKLALQEEITCYDMLKIKGDNEGD
jgi:ribonuclease D